MRLDKYLKVSRLIKRRTIAKEVCDCGKVVINNRIAKSSSEVKKGDIIELNFATKTIKLEVLDTPVTVPANLANELYSIIEEKNTAI